MSNMGTPFDDAQRIVLRGTNWQEARHLVLNFGKCASPAHFLHLLKRTSWPTAAGKCKAPDVQVSLGFSRRGLERALVPDYVLANFALKAPAFSAGAALRANRHLGVSGRDGPEAWDAAFAFTELDAVLSLHGIDKKGLDVAVMHVKAIAADQNVEVRELTTARRLALPKDERDPKATWAHFGFRDGLARVGIKGWTPPKDLDKSKPVSQYEAGEFLLGYKQHSGANPWITGLGSRIWPEKIRNFFCNGSFGVLHQIEQDVAAFERFVQAKAGVIEADEIRAKLCGRYPDGRPLVSPQGKPDDDFDYDEDKKGYLCPFGSHVRRMNPRGDGLPQASRPRPLIRRGMPYGSAHWSKGCPAGEPRGLMGQFFCASIEDQYEHLVGQWADRVPLGSEDLGGARDPIFGAHEPGDGAFAIPRDGQKPPIMLNGLRPFTRTVGVAYLFYPSLATLGGMADRSQWYAVVKDDA